MQCRLGARARARAKKETGMPTLEFHKKTGDADDDEQEPNDNGVAAASHVRTRARPLSERVIVKRQLFNYPLQHNY